jgi:hypothetical protein
VGRTREARFRRSSEAEQAAARGNQPARERYIGIESCRRTSAYMSRSGSELRGGGDGEGGGGAAAGGKGTAHHQPGSSGGAGGEGCGDGGDGGNGADGGGAGGDGGDSCKSRTSARLRIRDEPGSRTVTKLPVAPPQSVMKGPTVADAVCCVPPQRVPDESPAEVPTQTSYGERRALQQPSRLYTTTWPTAT